MIRVAAGQPLRFAWRANLRTSALPRWSVGLLALVVFGIQSLVIQPHTHIQPADFGFAYVAMDGLSASDEEMPTDDPFNPDLNDCLMCQSAHQIGQYLKPAAAVFALVLSVNYRTIDLAQLPQSPQPLSHFWQGRGPPQA